MKMLRSTTVCFVALTALLCTSVVIERASPDCAAQESVDPVVEEKAREVFLNVMSPFCPGRSLADCPSGKAHELKDEIRAEVKSGVNKEAILNRIFSKYGENYRAMPKVEGIGILAWFAPVIFFIVGVTIIGFWLAKRNRVVPPQQPSPVSTSLGENGIDERVAREIQKAIDE